MPEITSEEADAAAAVMVSSVILVSLIPLFRGLGRNFTELREIRGREAAERIVVPEYDSNSTTANSVEIVSQA